ncbi:molybdopterin-dependent oxidoreductase [Paenibacillus cymbidii]|uniref:molybdopterin-dependent oxidoreductase n=1 Tax=Paenibacillus cymbidii TaxID=1639034 RepID=UPI0010816CEE|nr:molybdopterin-dependent oxidoreductase [Paenibacillus cymbidii]
MARVREWLKLPYGRKLKKLHAWNAWIVLLLAVSGIVLYAPFMRGVLQEGRVWLKQVHIYLGIASIVVLLLYVPLIAKHLKQLVGKRAQQWNLGIVLIILLGWSLSGLVLWQFRHLPTHWANAALFFHDLFTWVGVPYAVYHSISRSRWIKQDEAREKQAAARAQRELQKRPADGEPERPTAAFDYDAYRRKMTRRTFVRLSIAGLMAAVIGPSFYRWMKAASDTGGSALDNIAAADGNRMLPPPTPLAESAQVVGGGAKGNFRIYTVTKIPSFSSDNWHFDIGGLVDQPQKWTWEQFLALPRKVQVSDFHCVTGWSVYKCTWEGIPLSELLKLAGVQPKAKYVKFYSGDGEYTDALSLEQAHMDDVLVAVMLDGKPLPQDLGGPVRLVVPKMYAYKSVKWLQAIELIEKSHIGYWEVRGYDNDAWV